MDVTKPSSMLSPFKRVKLATRVILGLSVFISVIALIQLIASESSGWWALAVFAVTFLVLTAYFLKCDMSAVYAAKCYYGMADDKITGTKIYKKHLNKWRVASFFGLADVANLVFFHTCKS